MAKCDVIDWWIAAYNGSPDCAAMDPNQNKKRKRCVIYWFRHGKQPVCVCALYQLIAVNLKTFFHFWYTTSVCVIAVESVNAIF